MLKSVLVSCEVELLEFAQPDIPSLSMTAAIEDSFTAMLSTDALC